MGENVNNSLHISHYQMIREKTTGLFSYCTFTFQAEFLINLVSQKSTPLLRFFHEAIIKYLFWGLFGIYQVLMSVHLINSEISEKEEISVPSRSALLLLYKQLEFLHLPQDGRIIHLFKEYRKQLSAFFVCVCDKKELMGCAIEILLFLPQD